MGSQETRCENSAQEHSPFYYTVETQSFFVSNFAINFYFSSAAVSWRTKRKNSSDKITCAYLMHSAAFVICPASRNMPRNSQRHFTPLFSHCSRQRCCCSDDCVNTEPRGILPLQSLKKLSKRYKWLRQTAKAADLLQNISFWTVYLGASPLAWIIECDDQYIITVDWRCFSRGQPLAGALTERRELSQSDEVAIRNNNKREANVESQRREALKRRKERNACSAWTQHQNATDEVELTENKQCSHVCVCVNARVWV